MKVAFIGFQHGHISALYRRMVNDPADWKIVAACDEDPVAASFAEKTWGVTITHTDFQVMLDQVDFDVLAVGDYFSIRGARVLEGLRRGKHIIADKPLCTSLEELDQIQNLALDHDRKIGLMLDLRSNQKFVTAKQWIDAGKLGKIQSIHFCGAHSLNFANRPKWYFEENKHGGVINDLAIHGLDMVEYLTGQKITELTAARTWNAFAPQVPGVCDAAQMMFALENGCGVIGDASYIQPDELTREAPFCWRFTLWGERGVMELNCSPGEPIIVYGPTAKEELLPCAVTDVPDYLQIYRDELSGTPHLFGTDHILNLSRKTLQLQEKAIL